MRDALDQFIRQLRVQFAESAFLVVQCALQDQRNVRLGQLIEHEDSRPRQQCPSDLEGWILSCGANESNCSILHRVQECVLLGLIEAMNLVDKKNGAPTEFTFMTSLGNCFAQIFHTGKDSGETDETSFGGCGE